MLVGDGRDVWGVVRAIGVGAVVRVAASVAEKETSEMKCETVSDHTGDAKWSVITHRGLCGTEKRDEARQRWTP